MKNKTNSVPCEKCGTIKKGKEKVFQNIWKGNERQEILAGYLYYCKKCVDSSMEDFNYWEKLADKLKMDCVRYWQLSYVRNSDEELGFRIHAEGKGDRWLSGELDKEENKELLTIIQKNDKVAFRKFTTEKLTELVEREKETRANRSELDQKERKLKNILNKLETVKYEVNELIEEFVPIWKEARKKYETNEIDNSSSTKSRQIFKKITDEFDKRVKRVGEKGECYFLCGKILKEQKKMLVGKATHIRCCLECGSKLWKKESDKDATLDCPPPYWEVDMTEPNWEEKLNSQMVELATVDLDTRDLYSEIERRKSLHKKEVKECWECHEKTDDWEHEYDDDYYQCRHCYNDLIEQNKKWDEEDKQKKIECSECGKTRLLGYRENYYTTYCKECWEFIEQRDKDCYEWCAEDCPFKKPIVLLDEFEREEKQVCPSCEKPEDLEICDECQREFCMKCLGLYHGSEYLFCQSCFNRKNKEEKAIMKGKKKGTIQLGRYKDDRYPLTLNQIQEAVNNREFGRLYRSPKIEKKYRQNKEEIISKLKEKLENEKDSHQRWLLMKNDYPYYLEKGLEHWLLWDSEKDWKKTNDDWFKAKKKNLTYELKKKQGLEVVTSWINPPQNRSIGDIPHVHLVLRKLEVGRENG